MKSNKQQFKKKKKKSNKESADIFAKALSWNQVFEILEKLGIILEKLVLLADIFLDSGVKENMALNRVE